MNHAITTLQIALDTARNNEPIHRTEGNIGQADACLVHIEELTTALSHLTWIANGWHKQPDTFAGKIAKAINQHSLENGSDTPDFILAEYLKRCLENFDTTVQARTNWYGPRPTDGEVPQEQEYRILEVKELICEGDEAYRNSSKTWVPSVSQGCIVNESDRSYYRRPVKRSLDNPPQSDNVPS